MVIFIYIHLLLRFLIPLFKYYTYIFIVDKNLPIHILNSTSEEDDIKDVTDLLDKLGNGQSLSEEDQETLDRLKERYPDAFEGSDESNDSIGRVLAELGEYITVELLPGVRKSNQGENDVSKSGNRTFYDEDSGSEDSNETIVPGRNYPDYRAKKEEKDKEENDGKEKDKVEKEKKEENDNDDSDEGDSSQGNNNEGNDGNSNDDLYDAKEILSETDTVHVP